MSDDVPAVDPLVEAFAVQAYACKAMGSPLYARLATYCARAVTEPGPIARLLAPHRDDAPSSILPLRLFAPLHRLALSGDAPELARHFPSCGGDGDAAAAATGLSAVVERHFAEIAAELPLTVQTNEVGRAAALLCGFLEVAATTRLPLRVLELGASAGLNLRFDRYRYVCGAWSFGDPAAALVLDDHFAVPPPLPPVPLRVAERRGCDPQPIDAATPAGALRLRSYLWPDQSARRTLLDAAIGVATSVEAIVDREGAATWLERELATPRPGLATVVFHSVVMQYVAPAERAAIDAIVRDAGARATPEAPLARLSLEPRGEANVVLQTFPGDGRERAIARATMHGRDVRGLP